MGRTAIERALTDGYRESIQFLLLVVNTVDCLLLRGDDRRRRRLSSLTTCLQELTIQRMAVALGPRRARPARRCTWRGVRAVERLR